MEVRRRASPSAANQRTPNPNPPHKGEGFRPSYFVALYPSSDWSS